MIPHNKPSIGPEESQAIAEVIASGWIASGEKVKQFEQDFADYVGVKYAIAVNSGTAALYIALKDINATVSIPTYACAALVNAINMTENCRVRLCDINKDDFNMIQAHEDSYCAIIPHTFGVPCEIEKNGRYPYIIEDCSQALGSYINGQHVGLQGDIGIFSFGPSKMITTGSGGMIVTNNKDLADKAREFIDYDKHIPAFNFGMNDMQAAMGIEQLKKLPTFLRKREYMAMQYIKHILDSGKYWAVQEGGYNKRNWYRFVIVDECVDRLKQHLADNGITAIVPIRQDELLHNMVGLDKANFTNAEYVASHSLSLPIYPDLYDTNFVKILRALRSF
jgi:perosamine synthetase